MYLAGARLPPEADLHIAIDDEEYFSRGEEVIPSPDFALKQEIEAEEASRRALLTPSVSRAPDASAQSRRVIPGLTPPPAVLPQAVVPAKISNFSLSVWEDEINWEGQGPMEINSGDVDGYAADEEDGDGEEGADNEEKKRERMNAALPREAKIKRAEEIGLVYHDVARHDDNDHHHGDGLSVLLGNEVGGGGKEAGEAGDDAMDIDEGGNGGKTEKEEEAKEDDNPFHLAPPSKSLFPHRNRALDDGSFLNYVIWDMYPFLSLRFSLSLSSLSAYSLPPPPSSFFSIVSDAPPPEKDLEIFTKLVLDANDPSLIFKEESESEEESEEGVNELEQTLVRVKGG